MADEMNKSTPVEEEIEIITLTDENGEDMDFEFLDQIDYEGKRYAVLLPKQRATFLLMMTIFSPPFLIFSKRNSKTNSTSQKNKTIEPGSFQTKKIPRKHIKNMLSEYLFSLAKKNFCAKFLL